MVANIKKINLTGLTASKLSRKKQIIPFLYGGLWAWLVSKSHHKKPSRIKQLLIILFSLGCNVIRFYVIIGLISLILVKPIIPQIQAARTTAAEAIYLAKNQDLVGADQRLNDLDDQLQDIADIYQKVNYLQYIPVVSWYYQDGQRVMVSAQAGVDAGKILLDTVAPYADVLGFKGQGSFTGGTAEDRITKIVQTLDKVTPKLDDIVAKIDMMEANVSAINPNHYPVLVKGIPVREQITNGKNMLGQTKQTINDIKPVIKVLPAILGYPDEQKYLVLFQNDGELRPTGGFITAYSVFDVDSGKARAGGSDDIYSLDKRLGNKLPAPEVLAQYLNVQSYHLRDMNLSPDFKQSMELFLSHYESINGVEAVDGVIGIDTNILSGLIGVLGPVDVPGYGTFTIENDARCHTPQVVCALEYIVDEPLPDIVENRKSTILGPLMQELMFKAYGSPKQHWPDLLTLFIEAMKQKHMLLYFKDEERQLAAEAFGAAGRIKDFDGDYLAIVDANLGGAKSNLYVTSEVEQKYEITDSGLVKELTITYNHPEPMDDCSLERAGGLCLSGVLQDYFRVYVPAGSELIEGMGSETEVATSQNLGKTVFSGFFKLRGDGGRAKIVLRYQLPDHIIQDNRGLLLIQKQAGTDENKYHIITPYQATDINLKTDEKIKLEL